MSAGLPCGRSSKSRPGIRSSDEEEAGGGAVTTTGVSTSCTGICSDGGGAEGASEAGGDCARAAPAHTSQMPRAALIDRPPPLSMIISSLVIRNALNTVKERLTRLTPCLQWLFGLRLDDLLARLRAGGRPRDTRAALWYQGAAP